MTAGVNRAALMQGALNLGRGAAHLVVTQFANGRSWVGVVLSRIEGCVYLGDVTLARCGRVHQNEPVHSIDSVRLKEVPEPRSWRWRPSC